MPDIPNWLKGNTEAEENWQYEGDILRSMRIMTKADRNVFAIRCYLWSQIIQLVNDVKEEGYINSYQKVDSLGNEFFEYKSNPKVKQLDSAMKEFRYTGALLGLDPSDRTKLQVPEETPEDPMEKFLKKKGHLAIAK